MPPEAGGGVGDGNRPQVAADGGRGGGMAVGSGELPQAAALMSAARVG